MKYYNENTLVRDKMAVMESKQRELEYAHKQASDKSEQAHRDSVETGANERKRLEDQLGKQNQMLSEELRVNEILNGQLQITVEKLKQELKEVKLIIKVPRMHFKYLERLEFDDLVNQRKEFEGQSTTPLGLNHTTTPMSTTILN